ncbi:MAG: B12-binding domain-containing radical SAM protein [Deltaproteobacteria bacterium]|nr:B12-binding domain-containing radical SAM protein [Deltaproteobacteria bacterium]
MKVLLVAPYTNHKAVPLAHWTPLNVTFIAALLRRNGHDVSIFDRHGMIARLGLDRNLIDRSMIDHVRRTRPDMVGFNTVSPLIYDTIESVALIRSVYSGPMVAGGHHATALPDLTLRRIPELCAVVEGEGEIPMVELVSGAAPETIPGVWWRKKEDQFIHTPPHRNPNLDDLPFPAFDLLDMKYYTRPSISTIRGFYLSTVSILSSRGCERRCDFCSESSTYGRGVRFHSVDYVMEWIRHILKNYGVEALYFMDNDFLIDERRAGEICERMLSEGMHKRIKWAIQARANRIQPAILRQLKRAGCILIEIGIESGLQDQLNSVRKGTTVQVNERAVKLIQRHRMHPHLYMITGFEGETLSDLEKKLAWIKHLNPASFSWFPLQLYPGTALYEKRGNRFFEENEWTRERIQAYYKNTCLASFSPRERDEWMKIHFQPFFRWRHHVNLLLRNRPLKLARFIYQARTKSGIL